ncbi:hypothetical protein ACOSP7_026375 [Xanthoceras sorbifolium]
MAKTSVILAFMLFFIISSSCLASSNVVREVVIKASPECTKNEDCVHLKCPHIGFSKKPACVSGVCKCVPQFSVRN